MASSISNDEFASGFVTLIGQFKANAITANAFTASLSDLVDDWDAYTPAQLASSVNSFVANQRVWQKELRDWWAGSVTDGPFNNGMFPFTNDVGVTAYAPCPALLQNPVLGPAGQASNAAATAQAAANTAVAAAAGINANTALIAQNVGWAQANATAAAGSASSATAANTSAWTAKAGADTTKTGADTANTNAQAARVAAQANATAAAGSAATAVTANTNAWTAKTSVDAANVAVWVGKASVDAANTSAWTAKAGADTANTSAWTAKAGADSANAGAWSAKSGADTANAGANTARVGAETANTNSNAAKVGAETANTNANASKLAAANSATAAAGSATTALGNAVVATTQAGVAISNAVAAAASAVTASTQAGIATSNATISVTQAGIATNSAVSAAAANTSAWLARTGAAASEAIAVSNATLSTNRAIAAENANVGAQSANASAWNAANAAANSAAVAAAVSNAASYQLRLEKDQPNGYAGLDGNGKIKAAQFDPSVLGALSYVGTWNASTNSPAIPAAASSNKGQIYKVSTAGTSNVSGITDWQVGDMLLSNGSTWDKIDNTESVTSVVGRTGAVTLTKTDVGLSNVDNTSDANKPLSNAEVAALALKLDIASKATPTEAAVGTDDAKFMTPLKVAYAIGNATISQAQVSGLSTALTGKVNVSTVGAANGVATLDATTKLPVAQLPTHTHAISDVTNLQTNLDAKLSTANAATLYQAVSAKAVANGYASLDASAKLPVAQLPTHTHVIADVTNLQASLDAKLSITNATVYQLTSAKGAANGYAGLDASAKLSASNLPTLTKTDVGLSNVDNTADLAKPISNATQIALNAKLADGDLVKADRQQIVTPTISGGALTLDLSQGSVFSVSWNANITSISITNAPTGSVSFTLILTGAGGSSVTWNTTTFKFPGGTAPTLISTTGAMNYLALNTLNQGTRVNVFFSGATI